MSYRRRRGALTFAGRYGTGPAEILRDSSRPLGQDLAQGYNEHRTPCGYLIDTLAGMSRPGPGWSGEAPAALPGDTMPNLEDQAANAHRPRT